MGKELDAFGTCESFLMRLLREFWMEEAWNWAKKE